MGMNGIDILKDLAQRPLDAAEHVRSQLDAENLNAHPGGHDNSPAWLLWHAAREIDEQVAALSGRPTLWVSGGWANRLGLEHLPADDMGFGNTAEQARAVVVVEPGPLFEHLEAVVKAEQNYLDTLNDADLDDVIDENWNPPVTRGARLVSVSQDALMHLGQVAYIVGMPNLAS